MMQSSDSSNHQEQDDPFVFSRISWRRRLEQTMTATRPIRGSNYVQLATTNVHTGQPRCRTVVMRGWVSLPANHRLVQSTSQDDDDNTLPQILQFCTDARSDKVTESLAQTSDSASSIGSEIVWWFPTVGEQYRLRGELVFVGTGGRTNEQALVRCDNNNNKDPLLSQARLDLWTKLSPPARQSFFQTGLPGQAFVDDDDKTSLTDDSNGPPPDNFLLVLLVPNRVDYLYLGKGGTQYRQVDTYSASTQTWSQERVNP